MNAAYLDAFGGRILGNAVDNIVTYSNGATLNPCRCMMLTDGNIAEDLYDYWNWGNIIGYADLWQTYSGSDNLRGTINQTETTLTNNLQVNSNVLQSRTKHFVVDFPANAANGTFSSIYLLGGAGTSGSVYYPGYYNLYAKLNLSPGSSSVNAICFDDNNFYNYVTTTSGTTTLYVIDKRTYVSKSNIVLSFPVYAMDYDKTNQTFWVALSDGTFKKYDKNFNLLSSYSKTSPYTMTSIADICVTSAYILIAYRGASQAGTSGRGAIAVYNKSDGTYNKTIDIAACTSTFILFRLPSKGKIFAKLVDSSGIIQIFNESDLSVYSSINSSASIFSTSSAFYNTYYDFRWDDDTQIFFVLCTNPTAITVSYLVPSFAHTLLASSVTKTSTNTMKIQYDLTVDYVYPLDMPAH